MDQHRFDALTRSLAAPKTRRGLLGGLAAILVAGRAAAQPRCPAGTDPCPGGGCADKKRDPRNCGRCGTVCPADAACVKGQCRCPAAGCTTTTTTTTTSTTTTTTSTTTTRVPVVENCTGRGSICDSFASCGDGNCGCYFTADGPRVCFDRTSPPIASCEGTPCTSSAECPDGSFCAATCCTTGICAPACGSATLTAARFTEVTDGGQGPDLP